MKTALWLLVGLRLAAQPACMLEGVTSDSVTGKPLAGVRVYAHSGGAPAYLRRSDAHGHYCFERLARGTYHIIAQHLGYLDQSYGSRPGADEVIELTVAGQTPLPAADFKLVPRPLLTGTVLHADGQPAVDTEVTVWQKVHTKHGPDQDSVTTQQTDDRGVFRFADLAPGTYYLSAAPDSHGMQQFNIEFLNGQGQRIREKETVTYFPGGADFGGARPIALEAGQELSGVTITLRKASLRRIAGRVNGAVQGTWVSLNAETEGIDGAMIAINPDGSFERSDLLPGKYTLDAPSGDRAVAQQEVDLTNSDVEGLVLQPRETFTVPLILKTEGAEPPVRPGQFWIILFSSPQGRSFTARGTADGNAEFQHVLPGAYRLSVHTQGEPYYLKQVSLNGAVQPAESLEFTAKPNGPLELTFSSRVATVEGRVTEGASGAVTVLLVEPAAGEDDFVEHRTSSDQDGRFHFGRIKPGKYRLFAIEGFEDGPWGGPELAAALHSAEIDLRESETRQVTVPLVTAKEWNAAVERFGR